MSNSVGNPLDKNNAVRSSAIRSSLNSKPNFASNLGSKPNINPTGFRNHNDSVTSKNPLTDIDGNASTTANKTSINSKPMIGMMKKENKPKDYSYMNINANSNLGVSNHVLSDKSQQKTQEYFTQHNNHTLNSQDQSEVSNPNLAPAKASNPQKQSTY